MATRTWYQSVHLNPRFKLCGKPELHKEEAQVMRETIISEERSRMTEQLDYLRKRGVLNA